MKTIKNLSVSVKYTVGLGNIQVPDSVSNVLSQGGELNPDDHRLSDSEHETLEWLQANVSERDAYSLEYDFETF